MRTVMRVGYGLAVVGMVAGLVCAATGAPWLGLFYCVFNGASAVAWQAALSQPDANP